MKNSDCKATGSISQQVISDHEKSVSASVFASSHLCEFVSPLCSVDFFCTPHFCRFRVCYLDFTLSLDSVVFWIIPLPCSFGILLIIYEVQWNNDVNTYVDFFTLATSCEALHYSSLFRLYHEVFGKNWDLFFEEKSFISCQNDWRVTSEMFHNVKLNKLWNNIDWPRKLI
jgi:hypothetical protein